jgi:hypothetical protein
MADDPCATLAALQAAKINLLTGQNAQMVRIENFQVNYQAVDMAALDSAILKYDALCAASQDKRPRRYAIRAGAVGRRCW